MICAVRQHLDDSEANVRLPGPVACAGPRAEHALRASYRGARSFLWSALDLDLGGPLPPGAVVGQGEGMIVLTETKAASSIRLHADITCKLGLLLRGDPAKVDRVATEEQIHEALAQLARLAGGG